ncbi:hypothetical protein Pla110_18270 [Polystyrenella longa]|uniref:Uncharacterized protein n=1 Tax=Polystyrenella longa TaxID=2528007 RepID=A0A518CLI9_9PLAN|nr:hypothetical protein Pla110_18270 [Polystyrenella longa]
MERVEQYEIDDNLGRTQPDNIGPRTIVILVLASKVFRLR